MQIFFLTKRILILNLLLAGMLVVGDSSSAFALAPETKFDKEPKERYGIVGRSAATQEIRRLIEGAAKTDMPVFITGETGTGKELVARAIHMLSKRRKKSLIAVSAAEIYTPLVESELSGHVKGAFTGAVQDRTGLFEAANEGTLFVDEIGDVSDVVQGHIWGFLKHGEITPYGTPNKKKVNVRFISTTNKDIPKLINERKFLEGLFLDINGFKIHIRPLRDRRADILDLAEYYLAYYADKFNMPKKAMSKDAKKRLHVYGWPGNVRELQSVIQRALLCSEGGTIDSNSIFFDGRHLINQLNQRPASDMTPKGMEIMTLLNKAGFVEKGPWMSGLSRFVERASEFDTSCIISGEPGTGQDKIVQAIHRFGRRQAKEPVFVNCAEFIDPQRTEDKLFGHAKGAFTDANYDLKGQLELADGGILVLEDVTSLSLIAQAKLLRVLQERVFRRIGETNPRKIDVQIIATTSADLEKLAEDGEFREDLYYRLNVLRLHLPSLAERKEDILELAQQHLEEFARVYGKGGIIFSKEASDAIKEHPWSGNTSELKSCIEQAVIMNEDGFIMPDDLRLSNDTAIAIDIDSSELIKSLIGSKIPRLKRSELEAIKQFLGFGPILVTDLDEGTGFPTIIREAKKALILNARKQTTGSKYAIAKSLDISKTGLLDNLDGAWGTTNFSKIASIESERIRSGQSPPLKIVVRQNAPWEYGLDLIIKKAVLVVLVRNDFKVTTAARALGISRQALSSRIKEFWNPWENERTEISDFTAEELKPRILKSISDEVEKGYYTTKIERRRQINPIPLKDIGDAEIRRALIVTNWGIEKAAQRLKISGTSLRRLLRERGIEKDVQEGSLVVKYLTQGPIRIRNIAPGTSYAQIEKEAARKLILYTISGLIKEKKYGGIPTKAEIVTSLQLGTTRTLDNYLNTVWGGTDIARILELEDEKDEKKPSPPAIALEIAEDVPFYYGIDIILEKSILLTLAGNDWSVQKAADSLEITPQTLGNHSSRLWNKPPHDKQGILNLLSDKMKDEKRNVITDYLKRGPIVIEGVPPKTKLLDIVEEAKKALIKDIIERLPNETNKTRYESLDLPHWTWYYFLKQLWGDSERTPKISEILEIEKHRIPEVTIVIEREVLWRDGINLAFEKAILVALTRNDFDIEKSTTELGVSSDWLIDWAKVSWGIAEISQKEIEEVLSKKIHLDPFRRSTTLDNQI